jgi:hypothetical protein
MSIRVAVFIVAVAAAFPAQAVFKRFGRAVKKIRQKYPMRPLGQNVLVKYFKKKLKKRPNAPASENKNRSNPQKNTQILPSTCTPHLYEIDGRRNWYTFNLPLWQMLKAFGQRWISARLTRISSLRETFLDLENRPYTELLDEELFLKWNMVQYSRLQKIVTFNYKKNYARYVKNNLYNDDKSTIFNRLWIGWRWKQYLTGENEWKRLLYDPVSGSHEHRTVSAKDAHNICKNLTNKFSSSDKSQTIARLFFFNNKENIEIMNNIEKAIVNKNPAEMVSLDKLTNLIKADFAHCPYKVKNQEKADDLKDENCMTLYYFIKQHEQTLAHYVKSENHSAAMLLEIRKTLEQKGIYGLQREMHTF